MKQDRNTLVQQILKLTEEIYNTLTPGVPAEWLSSDLTVAQLRVLLVLRSQGPSRMTSIASAIGIALPTATGLVDNLVRKGLVVRDTDPHDRRLVICRLSSEGRGSMNRLWALGQIQMKKLLEGLTLEQLQKANEVAELLLDNVTKKGG